MGTRLFETLKWRILVWSYDPSASLRGAQSRSARGILSRQERLIAGLLLPLLVLGCQWTVGNGTPKHDGIYRAVQRNESARGYEDAVAIVNRDGQDKKKSILQEDPSSHMEWGTLSALLPRLQYKVCCAR
jgi:hypothetical protein